MDKEKVIKGLECCGNKHQCNRCPFWCNSAVCKNNLIESVDKKFEKYDIGMAESELGDFFWTKFCDWYIELAKMDMRGDNSEATVATLNYVLTTLLKLLHPFIPFITEKIYLELPKHDESIMISSWPKKTMVNTENFGDMEEIMDIIKAIRNVRSEKNVPDNKKIAIEILPLNKKSLFESSLDYIKKLCISEEVKLISSEKEATGNSVKLIYNDANIFIPLESMVNVKEERERILKEIEKVKFEIERSQKMLSNQGFVSKAPKTLIDNETEKLNKNKLLLSKLQEEI